jgi:hypothetical protein
MLSRVPVSPEVPSNKSALARRASLQSLSIISPLMVLHAPKSVFVTVHLFVTSMSSRGFTCAINFLRDQDYFCVIHHRTQKIAMMKNQNSLYFLLFLMPMRWHIGSYSIPNVFRDFGMKESESEQLSTRKSRKMFTKVTLHID